MTATLDDVATRKRKDKPEPTAEQKLAEELVARAREQGVSLTGPDGLLKQLTKTVQTVRPLYDRRPGTPQRSTRERQFEQQRRCTGSDSCRRGRTHRRR